MTLALALALAPRAWAQQQGTTNAPLQNQNPAARAVQDTGAGQNRAQAGAQTETIRGVISGITEAGEVILDYRTNAAARTEGAFVTIVGSPVGSGVDEPSQRLTASETENRTHTAKDRRNVYIAWLSPRTRITERGMDTAGSDPNQRRNEAAIPGRAENREITFDQLEVGDHVEIQFARQEESGATNNVHLSQQMRQKHGRDRTFVGHAMAISLLPRGTHEKTEAAHVGRANERPR
jgi:hypothetical protein